MRRDQRALVTGREGFSLIEVVLVLLLVGVLAAILINPLRQGVQGYVATEARADLTSQARQATNRMVREMRNIQKEADNTPNITVANATSITFVDVLDNTISFSLSGSAVQRNADTLADKISGLQFRYFDGSNTELSPPLSVADRDNVRRILLVLTLQDKGETVVVANQAFLRELTGL